MCFQKQCLWSAIFELTISSSESTSNVNSYWDLWTVKSNRNTLETRFAATIEIPFNSIVLGWRQKFHLDMYFCDLCEMTL